jgi:antitoxin component YwqK of YwqJK toxin-antitoxin module
MYYPNGKVKQRNIFKNGKMVDKSITFMSNGNEDRNELI